MKCRAVAEMRVLYISPFSARPAVVAITPKNYSPPRGVQPLTDSVLFGRRVGDCSGAQHRGGDAAHDDQRHAEPAHQRQLVAEDEQIAAGVSPDFIRLSIGLEDIDDILWDLDTALNA